jgi:hypothetical protein
MSEIDSEKLIKKPFHDCYFKRNRRVKSRDNTLTAPASRAIFGAVCPDIGRKMLCHRRITFKTKTQLALDLIDGFR